MAETNPAPGTTVLHCRLLRCKEMFVDTGEGFDIRNTGSGIFWCSHTQNCLGPDGQAAGPENCGPERSCYEAF